MLDTYTFSLEYSVDGVAKTFVGAENDDYSISAKKAKNTLKITLLPKKELVLKNAFLLTDFAFTEQDRVYVNGYQSWTTSREYGKSDVQKGLLKLAKKNPVRKFCTIFGDYDFQEYSLQPGVFHSYSYTYINREGDVSLFGTLSEKTGYTIMHFDMPKGKMTFQKDIEGVTTAEEYLVFDLYYIKETYERAFDAYFAKLALPKLRLSHMAGYTSWYNYYGGITEEILSRDIDGLETVKEDADIFQIDDGYQTATGDWQTVKTKLFPHGMKYLTDKIHGKGFLAAPQNADIAAFQGQCRGIRGHIGSAFIDNGNDTHGGADFLDQKAVWAA